MALNQQGTTLLKNMIKQISTPETVHNQPRIERWKFYTHHIIHTSSITYKTGKYSGTKNNAIYIDLDLLFLPPVDNVLI